MNSTIAAIASGLTESGIGIVRISGPESYEIIRRIFVNKRGSCPSFEEPGRIHYGFIRDPENVSRETLDEVLVMNMRAPHSYTGEDTIEIDCHGGVLMMKRILQAVLKAGAAPAEPGEFTKRAFLNGRIDLAQAESVQEIIRSANDRAADAALDQLKGRLSDEIREIRKGLIHETAYIESALDDPEHYSLEAAGGRIRSAAQDALGRIGKLLKSFEYGRILTEGIKTVILGKPNAGKSSLLNALLGEDRAIVTSVPGTTRDAIREQLRLGSLSLNITDTAGIRESADPVEQIGIERALKSAEEADLILLVLDLSEAESAADRKLLELVKGRKQKVLYLFNKSDLPRAMDKEAFLHQAGIAPEDVIELSAREGHGLERLAERMEELFEQKEIAENNQVILTSYRHQQLLKEASEALKRVMSSVDEQLPEDFYTIDLMDACEKLGLITGEEADEDLVEEIFSSFCMGK